MPHSSHASSFGTPLELDWRVPWRRLAAAGAFCLIVACLPTWMPMSPAFAALLVAAAVAAGSGLLWTVRSYAAASLRLLPTGEWEDLASGTQWRQGPGTRVFAGLVVLELVRGRRHRRWWLTRESLPAPRFRELKCRLRLGPTGRAPRPVH